MALNAVDRTLGLPVVTAWLSGIATFLPRVAVAILIIALGTAAARVASHVVRSTANAANMPMAERLGRVDARGEWDAEPSRHDGIGTAFGVDSRESSDRQRPPHLEISLRYQQCLTYSYVLP
jgi:hypothetical protein